MSLKIEHARIVWFIVIPIIAVTSYFSRVALIFWWVVASIFAVINSFSRK